MSEEYRADDHDWEAGEFEHADRPYEFRCRRCGLMYREVTTDRGHSFPIYSHLFMAGCDMRVVKQVMGS